MKLSAQDPYIYKIFRAEARGGGGYVGQDSGTGIRPYNRIFNHIETAYGLADTSKGGGSLAIKEGGVSEMCFHVFDSQNCFGCGDQNFIEFNKTGKSNATEVHQKLTFAEMIGICAGMVSGDSEYNTWIGDQSYFQCDLSDWFEKTIHSIYSHEEGSDIIKGAGVKFGIVTMHIPDSKANVEKLLNPEYYALIRAFSYALTYRMFRGEQGENWLTENILNVVINDQAQIEAALSQYITTEKKKEVYHGNKVLPSHYQINSAHIRFDFAQDIHRIAKFIGERIGMASYDIATNTAEKLGVILKSVKSSNGQLKFKKHQISQNAKETLRIKRNAYVDNLEISQKLPKWYENAIASVQKATPSEKLHYDTAFIKQCKGISYQGCVNAILKTIPNCPVQGVNNSTLTGKRGENTELLRNDVFFGEERKPYKREDTLMSRTRQTFFKDKNMHILNQNGDTYYRQCVSIYMNSINKPLSEAPEIQFNLIANSEKDTPRMIEAINSYGTRYFFKPYTGDGICLNYTQSPENLKFG